VVLGSCYYINPLLGCLGVNHFHSLIHLGIPHSLLLICVLLVFSWKGMVGGGEPLLDGCKKLLIILRWNGCLCACY
jgi:hypothetical protein